MCAQQLHSNHSTAEIWGGRTRGHFIFTQNQKAFQSPNGANSDIKEAYRCPGAYLRPEWTLYVKGKASGLQQYLQHHWDTSTLSMLRHHNYLSVMPKSKNCWELLDQTHTRPSFLTLLKVGSFSAGIMDKWKIDKLWVIFSRYRQRNSQRVGYYWIPLDTTLPLPDWH